MSYAIRSIHSSTKQNSSNYRLQERHVIRIPDIIRTAPKILAAEQESFVTVGAPGIGKTAIMYAIADNLATITDRPTNVVIAHPAYDEPVDYKGLPELRNLNHGSKVRVMSWCAPDSLPLEDIVQDDDTNILFVADDIGQAHPQVQNAIARAFHSAERIIAGRKLHKRAYFCATTNRVEDAAAVFEMPSFARMRVSFIDVEVNAADWVQWANGQDDVPEEFIAFVHPMNKIGGSKHIHDFEPARRTNCSPRTLHIGAKHWRTLKDESPDVVDEWLSGILCPAFALEFRAHIRLYDQLPDINKILDGKAVPQDFMNRPDVMHLVITSLVKRAELKHINTLAQFLLNMPKQRVDFAAWLYQDLRHKLPKFAMQPETVQWAIKNKPDLVG